MLTQKDLRELQNAIKKDFDLAVKGLATKGDLQVLETNIRADMATKEDLHEIRTTMMTKEDFQNSTEGIINGIKTIIDMLGDTQSHSDKNKVEIVSHSTILDDHEERINALEQQPSL